MLGLVLIYFIGRTFYKLAGKYGKSEWGFAILGVVTYYAGTFILGIVLAIIAPNTIDEMNNLLLGLIALPFGLLACFILHFILNKHWEKQAGLSKNRLKSLESDIDNFDKPRIPRY